ncbi:MAG: hypothetical protein GC157_18505 [Frankiales bacterium]|nr:hypothetical protein [Frankiales bacterium]
MSAPDPSTRPDRCAAHQDEVAYYPCKACTAALEATRDHPAHRTRTADRAASARTAIDDCPLCDDTGYLNGHPCHHQPDKYDAAERGIAGARAALTQHGGTP